jgi:hypothetical protein
MRQKLDTIEEKVAQVESRWKQDKQDLTCSLDERWNLHQDNVYSKLESMTSIIQEMVRNTCEIGLKCS